MAREAIGGDVRNYSFPLLGGHVLLAAKNVSLPSPVVPLSDLDAVTNWLHLGPTVNGEVNVTISISTEAITTGVVPTERRKYITGQTGRVETRLHFYQPQISARASGLTNDDVLNNTGLSGGNRLYQDLFYGGKLGDVQALLVVHDFDINLVEDAPGGKTWEQQWLYTPTAQKDGDIVLTDRETRAPVVPFNFALLGYSSSIVTDRTVLIQQRWIAAA